jgi:hypothetical protein
LAAEKAHIRHTSYCRKKAKRPPRSRKRSCLACIKAKAHCNVATSPRCSRCRQKGIECKLERSQQEDTSVLKRFEPSSTIEADELCTSDTLSCSQSKPVLMDRNDASISHTPLDEPRHTASSQVDQIIMEQTSRSPRSAIWKSPATFPMSSAKDGADRWLPRNLISDQWNRMKLYTIGPQLSLHPVKAFTPRGATWGPFSLLRKYMTQTIRRYPYMMLSDKNSSPFIHHKYLMNNKKCTHKDGPGPLLRCAAIVELWRSKTPNNASYFWKILRIEQERLMQEISEYEDMIAINALQAVTIYFLLRLSSTDNEDTDFDVPLIQTMTQLLSRVRGVITAYSDRVSSVRPTICGWVMTESLLRTIAALLIIELLFDISPGMINGRCNILALWPDMLLPCSQQLWEAKTQAEWTQHYDLLGDKRPYYGELLQHEYLDNSRSSLLDQWMANVDDFGKLVINIASVAKVTC